MISSVSWSPYPPVGLCREPLVRWPWYHLNADATSVLGAYLHRRGAIALVSNNREFQELILIASMAECRVSYFNSLY